MAVRSYGACVFGPAGPLSTRPSVPRHSSQMVRSPFLRLDGTPLGGQTRCEVRIRLHSLIRRGALAAGVWAAMRSPPTVSAEEQRCFRARASTPSGKIPRGAIAGPKGSICALGTLHTVLQSGCTGLHSHQQCKRVPVSPRPHQYLLFPELLILATLENNIFNACT